MVIWVAKYCGIDHPTLMKMPFHEFKEWHEAALDFHEKRLEETASLLKEAMAGAQSSDPRQSQPRREDPLSGFY